MEAPRIGAFRLASVVVVLAVLAIPASARAVEPVASKDTFLQPNTEDTDGTAAYVRFDVTDMPLRVAVAMPREPAHYVSLAATREAVLEGLRLLERPLHAELPWFELAISENDPDAPIQVVWRRRLAGVAAGRGGISWKLEQGKLRVRGSFRIHNPDLRGAGVPAQDRGSHAPCGPRVCTHTGPAPLPKLRFDHELLVGE